MIVAWENLSTVVLNLEIVDAHPDLPDDEHLVNHILLAKNALFRDHQISFFY